MATQSKSNVTTKGICNFCHDEFDKSRMTQHLKHCKQRAAANAASTADGTEQKRHLFHILVEGRYNPQYWMHIEMSASESLYLLDSFLRHIWVECCDHLSAFNIAGTSYADEPDGYTYTIVGADEPEVEVVEGEEEEEDEEEEYEDLSPEEVAEEMGKILDEEPPEQLNMLPIEWLVELRRPRSRGDLVAFLKEKLKTIPGITYRLALKDMQEHHRLYTQKMTLQYLLDIVEDRGLGVSLDDVLKVGQSFTYQYDFGSTTYLKLKIVSERDTMAQQREEDDPVIILARNEPPFILCHVCGKPATRVVSGYYNAEQNAYCDACASRIQDPEMTLPVVNSPRVGVCGYTGS